MAQPGDEAKDGSKEIDWGFQEGGEEGAEFELLTGIAICFTFWLLLEEAQVHPAQVCARAVEGQEVLTL
eukprot:CAMPEP_0119108462 /NCGR_PEP_ID=MMETSP1180-20130426/14526_1 /TAXON_ID=3052 ORGANISM="Chlamydomonas cf sp, Strain CCMP681" /NCGR_SAMPLE_ID=MMETSP1180 /ASSEMBLY_ACC=CAM_ASM_000741 /LENGTH=68 /DNA_ID=CAMNT_0007094077 /DNA_START=648 /DNA_END=854 /DNA_ORIENTATION=+